MVPKAKYSTYFKNLNSVRFFAALAIILVHISQYEKEAGRSFAVDHYPAFASVAVISLLTLFVLSGFLITYLVIQEKELTGDVKVGKFYLRRILRIWPLYYLIVVLSYFVMPYVFAREGLETAAGQHNYWLSFIYALLFLPTFAVRYFPVTSLRPAWTLNVEEPFYLLWPLVIRKIGNPKKILYVVLIAYLCLRFMFVTAKLLHYEIVFSSLFVDNATIKYVFALLSAALGACLLHEGGKPIAILFRKSSQRALCIFFVLLVLFNIRFGFVIFECYALLIVAMVLNLAANKQCIITLEYKVLSYLGMISYGIYMFHVVVILIIREWFGNVRGIWLYLLVYGAAVGIAILSYELVEKKFLRIKKKYSIITTNSGADNSLKERTETV